MNQNNGEQRKEVRLRRIVSGGQTGVDRAALDAAIECGYEVGGWCPAGRRAEDGRIPSRYPLQETLSNEYAERTTWNVRDSDATLVLIRGEAVGGTQLTIQEAQRLGRPVMVVPLSRFDASVTSAWLEKENVSVLNIAGPRESEEPGVYDEARDAMRSLLVSGVRSTGTSD